MSDCLDMLDLENLSKQPESRSRTQILLSQQPSRQQTRNPSVSNLQKTVPTQSSRQYSQHSSRKNTSEADYHKIAYSQQIKRNTNSTKRKRSTSSNSSTSSMEQSFLKMEQKMKKFSQTNPELIDQKYMISGYLQLSKDYKNLLLTVRAFSETLAGVVKFGANDLKEDKILKVDQYFEKHSSLLTQKVEDYFKIKECFYRFLRMRIQEPYYYRVKKKIHLIEKQNSIFQMFRIYLEAFSFINHKGFSYFQDDFELIKQLQKPPTSEGFGELFDEKMDEIKQQIETTQDLFDGKMLGQIFLHKMNQIQEWKKQVINLLAFRYAFNIKYQLNPASKIKKIIKSKKLYDQIQQINETIEQFLIENYTLSNIYLQQITFIREDLELIKPTILQWNIKLREDESCKTILQLVRLNIHLKQLNKKLEAILNIKETDEYNRRLEAQATDMIVKTKLILQQHVNLVTKIKTGSEIKKDEYIQQQYNKFIMMRDYFSNLKGEFEL